MEGFLERIPESIKRFIDPSLPKDMRLMSAQGLVPVQPKDLALLLYCLTLDEDKEIRDEAKRSLISIPEGVMTGVLADPLTPPELLDYMARNTENESQLQRIILNPSTGDHTIVYLAETLRIQSLIDLIASNQERILRSADIVEALSKNPSISRSTLDRVISFFRLYLDKIGEVPAALGGDESDHGGYEALTEEVESAITEEVHGSFLDGIGFSDDLVEESEEDIDEVRRENLLHIIKQMNIAERVKLAILGNKEARTILIRDPNRIVASAVLKNPRLTDMEIINIAQSKTVDEDILREISMSRRWAKIYQVKVALVNNPKTPSHVSLNLIRHLRDRELRSLLGNKNLPGVITSAAKKIMQEKTKEGKA
ncbi:MAG TPA: hypothetical protein VNK81_07425 [Thermodesulfobacteriota bacterium]|jgi:hypothetical protein|nr:hypothetical protein [Thermodesulfobacteriota bacterium]